MSDRTQVIPDGLAKWLASGELGISSNTIATRLSGIDCMPKGWDRDHPHDPADFIRCQKLLDAVPEFRQRLCEMSGESPEWAGLVARWDEIQGLIDVDLAMNLGHAPMAFSLMRDILEGTR
jgi:hypothetical protein